MSDLKRIRVDQVGSLCSPAKLQEVFGQYKRGAATSRELGDAQDDAIRAIVAKQTSIGLPVVTDGELRRRNFQESFGLSVSGFEVAQEDRSMEGVTAAPWRGRSKTSVRPARQSLRGAGWSNVCASSATFHSTNTGSRARSPRRRPRSPFSVRTGYRSGSIGNARRRCIRTWTHSWPMWSR